MNINFNPTIFSINPRRRSFGVFQLLVLLVVGGIFVSVGLMGLGVIGDPNSVKTEGSPWLLYIFPVVGVIAIILGITSFIRSQRRNANISQLMQTGQKVQGVLIDLKSSGDTKNTQYQLIVSAPDLGGVVQDYVSDPLNSIGGLMLIDIRATPVPIDVYIDSMNPKNYYVDLADIPNLTAQQITDMVSRVAASQAHGDIPRQNGPLL